MKIKNYILATVVSILSLSQAIGTLISVNWDADTNQDGVSNGSFDGFTTTINMTNSTNDFGISGNGSFYDWKTRLVSDDITNISSGSIVTEGVAFDWDAGTQGTITINIGGTQFVDNRLTDPILVFNFLDNTVASFDFDDSLSLSLLDQNGASSASIGANNVVTTNGSHTNNQDHGFALQITGTEIQTISFNTNTNLLTNKDVGFSIIVDDTNVVPEPETAPLLVGLISIGYLIYSKKRKK